MNLLEETRGFMSDAMERANVMWVGTADGKYKITWERFCELAATVEYYAGYGAQEVAKDLVIVGPDWWMVRTEYDGAEGWALMRMPTYDISDHLPFGQLSVHDGPINSCGWEKVSDLEDAVSLAEVDAQSSDRQGDTVLTAICGRQVARQRRRVAKIMG